MPPNEYCGLWASDFAEWEAFYLLEPFGEEWRQTSTVAAMTASQQWFNGKFGYEKFMPVHVEKTIVRQTPEQIARVISGAFDSMRKHPVKRRQRHG